MKEIILKICISVVVFEVLKIITPSGNLSKFTESIYSVVMVIMIFNVIAGFDNIPSLNFDIVSDIKYDDVYEKDVYDEYQKRVKNLIYEKCGENAEIVFEGYEILGVVFEQDPGYAATDYLINELGVDRNDISIRKNQ